MCLVPICDGRHLNYRIQELDIGPSVDLRELQIPLLPIEPSICLVEGVRGGDLRLISHVEPIPHHVLHDLRGVTVEIVATHTMKVTCWLNIKYWLKIFSKCHLDLVAIAKVVIATVGEANGAGHGFVHVTNINEINLSDSTGASCCTRG